MSNVNGGSHESGVGAAPGRILQSYARDKENGPSAAADGVRVERTSLAAQMVAQTVQCGVGPVAVRPIRVESSGSSYAILKVIRAQRVQP